MRKKILSLILSLMLLLAMALPAHAHEVPDPERRGSISLTMAYQGSPVSGGTLTLYRVADVVSVNGDYGFAYTADFAGCTIPVTELGSADLPTALAEIAKAKLLAGTTLTVAANGKVKFSDLEIGLYLVVQNEAAPGYKKVNPFLVSVPYHEDGGYIYDVDTAPKNLPGPEEVPTEPPATTEPPAPSEPKLPQTGQTNWPVPVMAVVGMLLVTAGACLCVSGKKKRNET